MSTRCLSVLTFLAALALSPMARAATAGADAFERWDAANDAYQEERYEDARALYRSLVDEGVRHPDLYFNLGNAYARLGEKGRAAWMYRRALRLAPRHDDARHNLELVAPPISTQGDGGSFLFAPVRWVYGLLSAGEWAGLFEVFYLLTALAAVVWILARREGAKRAARWASAAGAVVTLLGLAFFVPRAIEAQPGRFGVVLPEKAVVRAAPGPDADAYFEALGGEKVAISPAPMRGWLRVKRPEDGRVGFLPEDAVGRL